MTYRTIDLSGVYEVTAVDSTSITLLDPQLVNSNWNYADLTGTGDTGYFQNVNLVVDEKTKAVDLGGSYIVQSVTAGTVTVINPAGTNADWGFLSIFPEFRTNLLGAWVAATTENWIGPFTVEDPDTSLLVANFIAQGGLFKDNGKKQTAFPITVQIEATPVDQDDNPVGSPQTFSTTIPGNSSGREMKAATLVCELTVPGRQRVRGRRVTQADYSFKGTVVDEVKWQDLYGIASVDVSDFGNVTTVHSRTYATEGALAVKERKLNMLVTRQIPTSPCRLRKASRLSLRLVFRWPTGRDRRSGSASSARRRTRRSCSITGTKSPGPKLGASLSAASTITTASSSITPTRPTTRRRRSTFRRTDQRSSP
jgi:hypothetical protein